MKIAFYTLGCKVNQYATQALEQLVTQRGHSLVPFEEAADAYVINTCTVTAVSDKKSRQVIRRARKSAPDAVIAVCGCYPQTHPDDVEKLGVDLISGTGDRTGFVDLLEREWSDRQPITALDDAFSRRTFEPLPAGGLEGRTRAMLKMEDGCVNFCSYCIIPYARGRVRSLPLTDCVRQARELEAAGYREIVLTGIEISSWGQDLEGKPELIEAIEAICQGLSPDTRVRLGSLEPDHITDRMIAGLAKIEKFCPQFHISLQSGCTKTLKSMNRHYTADEYADLCRKLRAAFPGATLTTDMMTGFHEETEADFEESLAFAKKIGFEKVHVFPYSQREGTAASKRGDSVPRQEKERRAKKLIAETDKLREVYFDGLVGNKVEVLVEQQQPDGTYTGYTRNYVPVTIHRRDLHIGDLVDVTITGVENADHCIAE